MKQISNIIIGIIGINRFNYEHKSMYVCARMWAQVSTRLSVESRPDVRTQSLPDYFYQYCIPYTVAFIVSVSDKNKL